MEVGSLTEAVIIMLGRGVPPEVILTIGINILESHQPHLYLPVRVGYRQEYDLIILAA